MASLTKQKVQICISDADRELYNSVVNKEHFLSVALKTFHSNPTLRAAFFKGQDVSDVMQLIERTSSESTSIQNTTPVEPIATASATTKEPVEQPKPPKRAW